MVLYYVHHTYRVTRQYVTSMICSAICNWCLLTSIHSYTTRHCLTLAMVQFHAPIILLQVVYSCGITGQLLILKVGLLPCHGIAMSPAITTLLQYSSRMGQILASRRK